MVMTHGAELSEKKVHNDIKDTSLFNIPLKTTTDNRCYIDDKEYKFDGYQSVVRTDTGQVMGRPRSKNYKVVNPVNLFNRHAEKLLQSDLPVDNLEITDYAFDNGAKSLRTVKMLDFNFPVGKENDTVKARQDIFTSLDLSWKFSVFNGGYRDLCENTCVFGGERLYHNRKKHTKGLSVEAVLSKLDKSLEQFYSNRDEMRKWQQTSVTDGQVAKLLSETICKKPLADLKKSITDNSNVVIANTVNQKLFDYLMYRFWDEVPSLGKNLWAVYNALTHWSTHTQENWERENDKGVLVVLKTSRGSSNADLTATRRADQVRAVLDSKEWQSLVN